MKILELLRNNITILIMFCHILQEGVCYNVLLKMYAVDKYICFYFGLNLKKKNTLKTFPTKLFFYLKKTKQNKKQILFLARVFIKLNFFSSFKKKVLTIKKYH
jgi:hypothetical protein